MANASSRDRAGWDYVVDFRPVADGRRLDARPAPASVRVQVKTQWSDSEIIKLRLSSAELLAKHAGPSFICVLSVNRDLTFDRMRVLHCRGELLARILKQLRRAEAAGKKPNLLTIAVRPDRYETTLPCTGEALRSKLEKDAAGDALTYLTAKSGELESLGFEPDAHSVTGRFHGAEEAIVDALLGMTTIEAEDLKCTETRFGIPLPADDGLDGAATMQFLPTPDRSEVIIHDRAAGRRFSFKAKTFRLPAAFKDLITRPKVLFRTEMFDLTIASERGATAVEMFFSLTLNGEVVMGAARKPAEWTSLYGALSAVLREGMDLEIRTRGKPSFRQSLALGANNTNPEWHVLSQLADRLEDIFRKAGAPNAKMTIQEIWNARADITTAEALLTDADTIESLSFITAHGIDLPLDPPPPMMFTHVFNVGTYRLAYVAQLELAARVIGDEVHWISGKPVPLGIRRVTSEASLNAYLESLPVRLDYRIITGVFAANSVTVSRRAR